MFVGDRQESTQISTLMSDPPAIIELGESMEDVMQKFESTGAWNLPITRNGKYCGFVSKSRIFGFYRGQLLRKKPEPTALD